MAAPPQADELIVLTDALAGYMSRLTLLKTRLADPASAAFPPCLANPALDRLRRTLQKKFPALSLANVEKDKGYDTLVAEAPQITAQLRDVYATLGLAQTWVNRVLSFLQLAREDLHRMNFDRYPWYFTKVMDLLSGYVRLHLLLHSMHNAARLCVALYAHAYIADASSDGVGDHQYGPVSQLVAQLGQTPTRKLESDFAHVAPAISAALLSLKAVRDRIADQQLLDRSGALDIMHRPNFMCDPALEHEGTHRQLLILERLRGWVLFGFLACPGQLVEPEMFAFLQEVLRDGFVVQVHGAFVQSAHALYAGLFTWFPPKGKNGLKFPRGVKPKKVVDACELAAAEQSWALHAERRRYCARVMQRLRTMVEHTPGILAPRFMTLLNALALTRGEVVWYFLHRGRATLLSGKKAVKAFDQAFGEDPGISTLLHLATALASAIRRDRRLVSRYYHEYLQGADLLALRTLVTRLVVDGDGARLSTGTQRSLRRVVETLGALPAPDSLGLDQTVDLVPLRLSWYRCLGDVSRHAHGASAIEGLDELVRRMQRIECHARWVDAVEEEVAAAGDFAPLWWCLDAVDEAFRRCLSDPGPGSAHVMAFMGIVRAAPQNVHRFCPEDQEIICRPAARKADEYLQAISDAVASCFLQLFANVEWLEMQTSSKEAAGRLERRMEKAAASRAVAASGRVGVTARVDAAKGEQEPLPGSPKQIERDQRQASALARAEAIASNLCGAMGGSLAVRKATQMGEFTEAVHDTVFYPNAMLRARLRAIVAQSIQTIAAKKSSGAGAAAAPTTASRASLDIVRPTVLLRRVRRIATTLHRITAMNFDVDVERMLREELLRNCYDENFAGVASPRSHEKHSATTNPKAMVHAYGKKYIDLIEKLLGSEDETDQTAGLCYSAFRGGFVRVENWQELVVKGKSVPAAEEYATLPEFVALCELIGPQGMRCIEHSMLRLIAGHTTMVRQFLTMNRRKLVKVKELMGNQLPHGTELLKHSTTLEQTDLLLKHSVSIGHALRLRELMQEATRRVLRRRVPVIYETVKLAYSQYAENITLAPELVGVDCLARECGINVGAADHTLIQSVRHLHTGADCDELWGLLPFAYGAAFTSKYWTLSKKVGVVVCAYFLYPLLFRPQATFFTFFCLPCTSFAFFPFDGTHARTNDS